MQHEIFAIMPTLLKDIELKYSPQHIHGYFKELTNRTYFSIYTCIYNDLINRNYRHK